MSWADTIWADLDRGFRFLFFDSFWGWGIVLLVVLVLVRKVLQERNVNERN
jgi:hypothetical protein